MVIIHLSRKIPVFNEFRTRDNPGASLTEVIGEKIVDYYIIAPTLKTAVQAQANYYSAFTGTPVATVEEILTDAGAISSLLNREIAQGVADVAAGKRPFWLVIVRNNKI
jgi:hypothetical protein